MSEPVIKMKFQPPTPDTPGFLRRLTLAMEYGEKMQAGSFSATVVRDLVEFLADYIVEPAGRTDAIEALYDASQAQFTEMLQSIMGVSTSADGQEAVPLASSELSKIGGSQE